MRLESFRIFNCFGFVDSGEIDLAQPNNLVYFLGRNSSGKTSVLRAISHFEHGMTPREHQRFGNYERPEGSPLLRARFSIDAAADNEILSVDRIVSVVTQRFSNTPLEIEEGESGYQVTPSNTPISGKLASLLNTVKQTYSAFISSILDTGEVWVEKLADGSYRFLTTEDGHDEFRERKQAVESRISNELTDNRTTFQVQNSNYNVNLSFEYIEGQLFRQFPEIFLFTDRFSLDKDLPRSIREDHFAEQQNASTEAFMGLLGKDTLGAFLRASGRKKIDSLQATLQETLDNLCEKINEDASSGGADELVRIFVDRRNDVRVILDVDGKESYYEHLSDNTKFLVAYHIFQEDRERKNTLNSILLFDEPNKGFHPSAEGKMLHFLESLAEDGNQVLVTTHSQHMIDLDRLSAIRIMGRTEDGTLRVSNRIYRPASPGGDILALAPVTEAMGLRYAQQLVVRDKIVVTEGYTDMLYLRAFKRILGHEADLHIAPLRGESQIQHLVPFLISQGMAFKIVLDSAAVKRETQRAFPDMKDDHFFVVPTPAGANPEDTLGIEDVLTKDDFAHLLERYGYAINAKKLANVSNSNYAKQEDIKPDLATRIYADEELDRSFFQDGTVNAFGRVLDFCASGSWFRV